MATPGSGRAPLERHGDVVLELVFTPDGKRLLSVANDDTVQEWRVDATQEELLAWIAANRYVPELTCQQRERYRIEPLCDEVRMSPGSYARSTASTDTR